MDSCTWVGTAARGVYNPSCQQFGILVGIPPKICQYCGRRVVMFEKDRKCATYSDYLEWKRSQSDGGSEHG